MNIDLDVDVDFNQKQPRFFKHRQVEWPKISFEWPLKSKYCWIHFENCTAVIGANSYSESESHLVFNYYQLVDLRQ